jgi:hypothetical protein
VPTQHNNLPKQNIIFDEVGKLASNLKYNHVAIPLNICFFYEQGNFLEIYLKNLANTRNSEIPRIPFTKIAQYTGVWGLRKLSKIMNQVVNLDQILPHNETQENRLDKDYSHKRMQLKTKGMQCDKRCSRILLEPNWSCNQTGKRTLLCRQ